MTIADGTMLYLARHGQSEWNNQGFVTGQLDPALSAKGREQSRALAQCLRDEPLVAIYASTLRRTVDTAQPTAHASNLAITRMAALDEIHMGELQGRHRDQRDPAAQALWSQWQADPWTFQVPGGERFDEFARRVEQALVEIRQRHRGQRVLIVGHRATNRVLLGSLLGWPRVRWIEIRPGNKRFYRVQCDDPPRITTIELASGKTGRQTDGFIM